jgi:hypothetical protein
LPKPAWPIILRLEIDRNTMTPVTEGYRIRGDAQNSVIVACRVFNLGPVAEQVGLSVGPGSQATAGEKLQSVRVPAADSVQVRWTFDLRRDLAEAGRAGIRLQATNAAGDQSLSLTLQMLPEAVPETRRP